MCLVTENGEEPILGTAPPGELQRSAVFKLAVASFFCHD